MFLILLGCQRRHICAAKESSMLITVYACSTAENVSLQNARGPGRQAKSSFGPQFISLGLVVFTKNAGCSMLDRHRSRKHRPPDLFPPHGERPAQFLLVLFPSRPLVTSGKAQYASRRSMFANASLRRAFPHDASSAYSMASQYNDAKYLLKIRSAVLRVQVSFTTYLCVRSWL